MKDESSQEAEKSNKNPKKYRATRAFKVNNIPLTALSHSFSKNVE